jgi:hypothetical protein
MVTNVGSNWGWYPPREVAKNNIPSACPLGFISLMQLNRSTSYSQNFFQITQIILSINLRPSLRASICIDLISITSIEKQKWLYTTKWKGCEFI